MEKIDMTKAIKPIIDTSSLGNKIELHPAFGKITISNTTGTKRKLCGSNTLHSSTISIDIHSASVEKLYSSEFVHDKNLIMRIELSHAQFANMISSVGNGSGTPCTFRRMTDGKLQTVPEIVHEDSNPIPEQLKQSLEETIRKLNEKISEVDSLIEKGKANKQELKSMKVSLEGVKSQLKNNIPFYFKEFEEYQENIVEDAKQQVNQTITNNLKNLGVESAKNFLCHN